MKILSPQVHGVIDYVVVALFALAPTLFSFGGTAQIVSYAVAGVHLLLSVTTAYPLGILKLVPFPAHGVVELIVVPSLVAIPWIFGFNDVANARNFFFASAALVAVVVALTNYKAAEASVPARPSTS